MKSSFCIDLQRFMLIPTKFPLTLYTLCGFEKNTPVGFCAFCEIRGDYKQRNKVLHFRNYVNLKYLTMQIIFMFDIL